MAMSMWNPTLADEMLVKQCPFPYEPQLVNMDGGLEDESIGAPFEPRMYQDIFDVLAAEQIGICAVNRVPETPTRGFVYGFEVLMKAGGCAASDPNAAIAIREYATRAHRDEAARSPTRVGDVYVLGRWVIELSSGSPGPLRSGIVALGAVGLS